MQLESQVVLWIIIAIVILCALFLSKRVRAKFGKFSISAEKGKKGQVTVEKIKRSKVKVENREGQDVSVKKVSDDSDVQIK